MATTPRVGMRAENCRVPRLDRHDALEENRGSRIRNGRERQDDADRFRYFNQAPLRKFADRANRTLVFHVVVHELRRNHVLQGFIFHHPKPGFLDRESGEILRLLQARNDHGLDDTIDVFLCVLSENRGGVLGLPEKSVQGSDPLSAETFGSKRDPNLLRYYFARDHYRPLSYSRGGIIRRSGSALRDPLLASRAG